VIPTQVVVAHICLFHHESLSYYQLMASTVDKLSEDKL
jgi:hypothetical protein